MLGLVLKYLGDSLLFSGLDKIKTFLVCKISRAALFGFHLVFFLLLLFLKETISGEDFTLPHCVSVLQQGASSLVLTHCILSFQESNPKEFDAITQESKKAQRKVSYTETRISWFLCLDILISLS